MNTTEITETPVIKSLNSRYTVKKFTQEKLAEEQVDSLLEAMRLSASSYGMEPWNVIVVENKELRKKIKPVAWNQSQVTDASHLLVLVRPTLVGQEHVDALMNRTAVTRNLTEADLAGYRTMVETSILQNKSELERGEWSNRQMYLALGTLLLAAAQSGVDATPMEGFEPAKVDEVLGLEAKGFKSVVLVALGVGAQAEDDAYRGLKKVRRPLDEVVLRMN